MSKDIAIKKVCVVGAGVMGSGIAQVSAQAGYQTALVDVTPEYIERGMASIRNSLDRFVRKGTLHPTDVDGILARIETSTSVETSAKDADYVIEAVFERADVKIPILQKLDEVCPEIPFLPQIPQGYQSRCWLRLPNVQRSLSAPIFTCHLPVI